MKEFEMDDELKALEQDLQNCANEEEAYKVLAKTMLPGGEDGELSEAALEMVAGGMSNWEAIQIVTDTFWDFNIKKRKKPRHDADDIYEALRKCDKMNGKVRKWCEWILENAGKYL